MADMHKNMAVALLQPQLNETINAQPRGDKDMRPSDLTTGKMVRDSDIVWATTANYIDGKLLPRHPMPAIRLEVDICKTWHDTVCIFDWSHGDIVYDYYNGMNHR